MSMMSLLHSALLFVMLASKWPNQIISFNPLITFIGSTYLNHDTHLMAQLTG